MHIYNFSTNIVRLVYGEADQAGGIQTYSFPPGITEWSIVGNGHDYTWQQTLDGTNFSNVLILAPSEFDNLDMTFSEAPDFPVYEQVYRDSIPSYFLEGFAMMSITCIMIFVVRQFRNLEAPSAEL
jgi:hypothetical protein